MNDKSLNTIWETLGLRYKSHPWHGINIGGKAPEELMAFIEVVPTDTVKYEVDKNTGYLKVDRPQKFSNIIPALYGFVPQTYCADEVASFCMEKTGRSDILGDGDPVDICVLTERAITHGDIIVPCLPIGGFRMIDGGEADDKIIAVLKGDEVYEKWEDISDVPDSIITRLKHYFLTYKQMPGNTEAKCEITHIYGREEARQIIELSRQDYKKEFGDLDNMLSKAILEALGSGLESMMKVPRP